MRIVRELVSIIGGMAGSVVFWYSVAGYITRAGMSGHRDESYDFMPLLLESGLAFFVPYRLVYWLYGKVHHNAGSPPISHTHP